MTEEADRDHDHPRSARLPRAMVKKDASTGRKDAAFLSNSSTGGKDGAGDEMVRHGDTVSGSEALSSKRDARRNQPSVTSGSSGGAKGVAEMSAASVGGSWGQGRDRDKGKGKRVGGGSVSVGGKGEVAKEEAAALAKEKVKEDRDKLKEARKVGDGQKKKKMRTRPVWRFLMW